jgi:hypothetical protein
MNILLIILLIYNCIQGISGLKNTDNNVNIIQNSNDTITKLMHNIDNNIIDQTNLELWGIQIHQKLICLQRKMGQIYFYHVRKAAGTTLKQLLQISSWRYGGYRLIFTEGKTLDLQILNQKGLLTVISLRDPIERIVSLYWYEHATFFITRNQTKLVSMNEWFDAWTDRSVWKTNFVQKNPGNVYIEVDNYYTKILSEWTGPEPVNEKDYEIAKTNLQKMDVVLITEWMNSITQIEVMDMLFPSVRRSDKVHRISGDKKIREKRNDLVKNWDQLKEKMIKINEYDLKLYDYAMLLAARRFMKIRSIVDDTKHPSLNFNKDKGLCSIKTKPTSLGIHQPPLHKGPFAAI